MRAGDLRARLMRAAMAVLRLRIFIALILVVVYFSLTTERFLSVNNLLIMAQHTTVFAILAIGMTLVILTGGIDLSVGSVVGFSGMVCGYLIMEGLPLPWSGSIVFFDPFVVVLIACLAGAVIGALNGSLITYLNVAPFIATLGTLYAIRGAALLMNEGGTFSQLGGYEELGNTGFVWVGNGSFLGVGIPVWILLALGAAAVFLIRKTPLGRAIYSIGGNERAARYSGIGVRRVKIFVYTFSGFCAALVGVVITGQLQTAHPMTGDTYELSAIAAVVLGGTTLSGGRGWVIGSIVGACVISILNDGMVMSGVSSFWQMVIMGLVIIVAVVVDQLQQRLQRRMMVEI